MRYAVDIIAGLGYICIRILNMYGYLNHIHSSNADKHEYIYHMLD